MFPNGNLSVSIISTEINGYMKNEFTFAAKDVCNLSKLNNELRASGCRRVLTHYRPAMPFGNRNIYFRGSFHSRIVSIKKKHPSGNLKFNNLDIFQSLKLHYLTRKILQISLKLNFFPNTLGCYGLIK